jgi:hypothetical protein
MARRIDTILSFFALGATAVAVVLGAQAVVTLTA